MERYKIYYTIVATMPLSLLCLFLIKDRVAKLIQNWKKIQFEQRKKRVYDRLLTELLSDRKWPNDYSYENIHRHGEVAQLLGIIGEYQAPFDLYMYCSDDIAKKLSLSDSYQPTIQYGICIELCKQLDIPTSQALLKQYSDDNEWSLIAEKIGVKHFDEQYGKKLPIPFVMYAFCQLFPYLKGMS